MASLYRRSNGSLYAQFFDKDRTPKRKRFSLKTKDKSTARELLAKWEKAVRLGEWCPWSGKDPHKIGKDERPDPLPLSDALERFLEARREMNVTANTIRTYEGVVGRFIEGVGESAYVRSVTASQLRSYVHKEGIADATKDKHYRALSTFLSYFEESGHIKENPIEKVERPRLEKKLPVAITPEELTKICEKMKEDYRKNRRKNWTEPGELLWRINAFWFSFLTGLRRAELCRLRWGAVDLESRIITLREQKSRKEERLPICKRAARILERMGEGRPDDFVFRSPSFTKTERNQRAFGNNLSRYFRTYRKKTGVREELNFHSLRKGFCSELAKSGAGAHLIMKAARHSKIEVSQRYVAMHSDDIRGFLDRTF